MTSQKNSTELQKLSAHNVSACQHFWELCCQEEILIYFKTFFQTFKNIFFKYYWKYKKMRLMVYIYHRGENSSIYWNIYLRKVYGIFKNWDSLEQIKDDAFTKQSKLNKFNLTPFLYNLKVKFYLSLKMFKGSIAFSSSFRSHE